LAGHWHIDAKTVVPVNLAYLAREPDPGGIHGFLLEPTVRLSRHDQHEFGWIVLF
jgi:hypothetical protein